MLVTYATVGGAVTELSTHGCRVWAAVSLHQANTAGTWCDSVLGFQNELGAYYESVLISVDVSFSV